MYRFYTNYYYYSLNDLLLCDFNYFDCCLDQLRKNDCLEEGNQGCYCHFDYLLWFLNSVINEIHLFNCQHCLVDYSIVVSVLPESHYATADSNPSRSVDCSIQVMISLTAATTTILLSLSIFLVLADYLRS